MAGQVTSIGQIDLTLGKDRVDVLGRHLELAHTGPARGDDVLGVVLIGGQADRAGLDAQRDVLADQGHPLALSGEVGRAGQDSRVIGVGAETGGQHSRITVVELDMQRPALCANGNRLI